MRRLLMVSLLAAQLAAPAGAGADDWFLSVPLQNAIMRVDAATGVATPFATGFQVPFYGFWSTDGSLYMPDKQWVAVFRISPAGEIGILTAGGLLEHPVTATPHPDGTGLVVSDLFADRLVRVDWSGTQTLLHDAVTSGGLVYGPGGMAFAPDGSLYVANHIGSTIIRIDPQGNVAPFSSDPLIQSPGGVAIDHAGNMYVAMYAGNRIVRFRLDTVEAEVFAEDINLMIRPNDVKLSRSGGLLTTTKLSNLLRIDATGQITELFQDVTFGDVVGIAVPADATACDGSFVMQGTGTAGSGGFVPVLRALFSPCPGHHVALELKDFAGGGLATLFVGTKAGAIPALGGTLWFDPAAPFLMIPLPLPGAGAGNGDVRIPFTVPANPALVGLSLHLQAAAADAAAPGGVALSNGLLETIGS